MARTRLGLRFSLSSDHSTESFFIYWLPLVELAFGMLVVAAVSSSRVAVLLSWRPLVWVGKISYSLYLWHFLWGQLFDWKMPLAVLALGFGFAALSYYLVEQRFRRRSTSSDLRIPEAAPA